MNPIPAYQKYSTPINLQQHMLRVASIAKLIVSNWTGVNIDTEGIIQACLFHDIAKPINFDLHKQARFGIYPKDIENLKILQENLKSKYGLDEHKAVVNICKEIGCTANAIRIVNNLEWSDAPKLISDKDLESLIPIYADMRIGPHGLLSLQERLNDLQQRTGKLQPYQTAQQVEDIIQNNTKIQLNQITNDHIIQIIDQLINSST